jgi:hypothetical protein
MILFTRPLPQFQLSGIGRLRGSDRLVLELLPLDQEQRDVLMDALYPDPARAAAFLTLLNDTGWFAGATPLQLRMAALLFDEQRSLPRRPLDLPRDVLALFVERGAGHEDAPSSAEVDALLGFIAAQTIRSEAVLTLEALEAAIRSGSLAGTEWGDRSHEAAVFMRAGLPARAQVLAFRGDAVTWAHRSFAEAAAAEREVTRRPNNAILVDRLGREIASSHHMALVLLAAAERAERFAAVQQCLRRCIERPASAVGTQLLAVRALAAGIDADGATRQMQVRLLLRMLINEPQEGSRCVEVFRPSDGLPDAWEVLERPALRADIVQAFEASLGMRRDRGGARRPLRLLHRERLILERLGLLSFFRDIEPSLDDEKRSTRTAPTARAGMRRPAVIEITDASGNRRFISMEGGALVAALREADLASHASLHPDQLLDLTVRLIIGGSQS